MPSVSSHLPLTSDGPCGVLVRIGAMAAGAGAVGSFAVKDALAQRDLLAAGAAGRGSDAKTVRPASGWVPSGGPGSLEVTPAAFGAGAEASIAFGRAVR